MRELLLYAAVLMGLIATLRYPFSGILMWTWFTCMQPHQEAFGSAHGERINLVIAIVTILAWLFSKERKIPRIDATLVLIFAFLVWVTINGFFAVSPEWSWPIWDRTWKTIALGLFVSVAATSKIRAHALVWSIAVSLLYYGIKGGIFTILTGGHNHVVGPPNSYIGDNNQLAVATLMVLPLINYLRLNSSNLFVSWGLLAATIISTFSILGSYSRGAFIALGGLGVVAWTRTRRWFLYPFAIAIVLVPALYFMPHEYFDRLSTIGPSDPDGSFHGRVLAWQVAYKYAVEHFPFGYGFSGSELSVVFNRYFPGEPTHAAHSIFFEVLGDNGFVGLGLYIAILAITFFNCAKIRNATRGNEEFSWAFDLAGMIQLALFVFCLGGSLLSMAYYDVFFILIGLVSAMRGILSEAGLEKARSNQKFYVPQPSVALPSRAARAGSNGPP